ncbi:MAG: hypothetical protein GW898_08780 [Thiomicrospira sp.]|nr:hypothetical protein [Thiomicrospira sp.]
MVVFIKGKIMFLDCVKRGFIFISFLVLTACGGSGSDAGDGVGESTGEVADNPSTSSDTVQNDLGFPVPIAISQRLSSGYRGACFSSDVEPYSIRDVYQFKTDGEVHHEMWVFKGAGCSVGNLYSVGAIFGEGFKLNHSTVGTEQNLQGLNTKIIRLDVTFNFNGQYVDSGSDSVFLRTYDDGQRMCFGDNEGHYREDDVNNLPLTQSSLATLYGSNSLSGVSERINLNTYDHCLEKF